MYDLGPVKISLRLRAFVFFALFVAVPRLVEGAAVTVVWDANRESDLAGYVVVYGTQSGQLTNTVDVGNRTSYQFTNLETGRTYFFAVKAYNAAGVSSALSAEVSAVVGSGVGTLSLANLVSNVVPPKPAGTTVIFAAAASGGTPPYQYKWFVADGSKTTVARDWSGDNTFTWRPSAANLNYAIKAWARSGTSTSDAPGAERILPFAILAENATVINLVADKPAPQSTGTQIVFTASAAAGGPARYEFQWSVYDGGVWKVVRDWSTNSRLIWSPGTPNPKYQVMVRVRGGQNLAANAGLTLPFPIQ